jgi:hypothetical protein
MLSSMPTNTVPDSKAQRNRVRRMAQRQGLRLTISRTRDPHACDYGRCYLADLATNCLVLGDSEPFDLDEVESWLRGDR